jgi:hypothetical protein
VRPEAVTVLARAVGRVEGEVPRSKLVERQPTVDAREVLREQNVFGRIVDEVDGRNALRQLQGSLHRVRQAAADPLPQDEPVDDHVDVVLEVAIEPYLLRQVHDLPVDARPREAPAGEVLE